MSKTITLSLKDEEHILIVEPGDNFIDLLTNTLGNITSYTYTVNGTTVATAKDLAKQLHNNMRIDAECSTRGAAISYDLLRTSLQIISRRNSARPSIKIETVHISCSSDSFNEDKRMAGLIVYSFDDQQKFEMNGHRCRTGYILIKESDNIAQIQSTQGIVHGKLFKWFFGIEPNNRFVGAGFSLLNGKLEFNSSVFNAKDDDYHDDIRTMGQQEIQLIKYAIKELYKNDRWKQNPTLSVLNMDRKHLMFSSDLPIQNYPEWRMNKETQ
jgi:hypothetical protein